MFYQLQGNQGARFSNLWGLHVTPNPCKNQLQSEKKGSRFSVLFKSFFKFPNDFCRDFRLPVILVRCIFMLHRATKGFPIVLFIGDKFAVQILFRFCSDFVQIKGHGWHLNVKLLLYSALLQWNLAIPLECLVFSEHS